MVRARIRVREIPRGWLTVRFNAEDGAYDQDIPALLNVLRQKKFGLIMLCGSVHASSLNQFTLATWGLW